MNQKNPPLTPPITQEITRVLAALCQEPGMKTKYIFLLISQYHSVSKYYHAL